MKLPSRSHAFPTLFFVLFLTGCATTSSGSSTDYANAPTKQGVIDHQEKRVLIELGKSSIALVNGEPIPISLLQDKLDPIDRSHHVVISTDGTPRSSILATREVANRLGFTKVDVLGPAEAPPPPKPKIQFR